MFSLADGRPDTDKPLDRARNRAFYQYVGVFEEPVVEETTRGCNLGTIFAYFQDTLVKLSPLLESELADLWHLPPDVVGIPWSERSEMPFLTTDRVFPLAQRNTPAFYSALGALPGGDCGDIRKCPGLDHIVQ